MSWAKGQMEREWSRGFGSVAGAVCSDCVEDSAIRAMIQAEATETECTYCGRTSDEPIAADADSVVDFVSDGLQVEYTSPEAELGWDSEEGDYFGEYFDAFDLFLRLGSPLGDGAFNEAVASAGSDRQWCNRDYYADRPEEALEDDWQLFVETVKHRARYVFLRLPPEEDPDEEIVRYGRAIHRGEAVLRDIAQVIEDVGLLQRLPGGTDVFRIRTSDKGKTYSAPEDLGSPPPKRASANRMSAAGIAMFYGASDQATALAETRQPDDLVASIGKWRTGGDAHVVDLDWIPDVPSLFEPDRRQLRPAVKFLHGFKQDISRRVEPDGREHIEYAPTQIVTEYLRYLYHPPDGLTVAGLVFSSAQQPGGRCYCLFVERERCYCLFVERERCIGQDAEAPEGSELFLRLLDARTQAL